MYLTRCTHYDDRIRCARPAEYIINDGKKNIPAAYLCKEHAQAVLDEYGEKLGYNWIAIPVGEFGVHDPTREALHPAIVIPHPEYEEVS